MEGPDAELFSVKFDPGKSPCIKKEETLPSVKKGDKYVAGCDVPARASAGPYPYSIDSHTQSCPICGYVETQ